MNRGGEREVREFMQVIEASGYTAHPFPRSPDGVAADEWHWDAGHLGIWEDGVQFYIETEEGERQEITPDLSGWEIE